LIKKTKESYVSNQEKK